jgi:hydrogenase maturation protease
MKCVLLIGIGNTLRGDDGAGIRAAELARIKFPQIDVLSVHGLSPELADTVTHYDRLFIVDACLTTAVLRVRSVTPADAGERIQSHTMTPEGILGLAATLYGRVPSESVLIEIPAVDCDFSETLSPLTAGQVEACLDVVGSYLVRS